MLEQCPWERNSEELISNYSMSIEFLLTVGKADYVGTNTGTLVVMMVGTQPSVGFPIHLFP